jgi:hypothetical protein
MENNKLRITGGVYTETRLGEEQQRKFKVLFDAKLTQTWTDLNTMVKKLQLSAGEHGATTIATLPFIMYVNLRVTALVGSD